MDNLRNLEVQEKALRKELASTPGDSERVQEINDQLQIINTKTKTGLTDLETQMKAQRGMK